MPYGMVQARLKVQMVQKRERFADRLVQKVYGEGVTSTEPGKDGIFTEASGDRGPGQFCCTCH